MASVSSSLPGNIPAILKESFILFTGVCYSHFYAYYVWCSFKRISELVTVNSFFIILIYTSIEPEYNSALPKWRIEFIASREPDDLYKHFSSPEGTGPDESV